MRKWVNITKWVVNTKTYFETGSAPTLIVAILSQLIMAIFFTCSSAKSLLCLF